MSMQMNENERERGVVLIIVLGLVALVASWASAALYEDTIEIRRAQDIQDNVQAWLGSESVMRMDRKLLEDDANHSSIDDLNEAWAQHSPPFQVEGGTLASVIIDENRYFNLNDLVDDKGVAQPDAVTIARRLFTEVGVDDGLVDVLVDWEDADDHPFSATGAEDARYYDKPYRVKNARLDCWSELRLLKGFNAQVIHALSKVAMVGPVTDAGITPVNINTAPKAVLLALFPKMDDTEANTLIAGRPYTKINGLTDKPWALGVNASRLSVSSNLFMVQTDATFGRARLQEEYVLKRKGTQVSLVSRSRLFAGLGT